LKSIAEAYFEKFKHDHTELAIRQKWRLIRFFWDYSFYAAAFWQLDANNQRRATTTTYWGGNESQVNQHNTKIRARSDYRLAEQTF